MSQPTGRKCSCGAVLVDHDEHGHVSWGLDATETWCGCGEYVCAGCFAWTHADHWECNVPEPGTQDATPPIDPDHTPTT